MSKHLLIFAFAGIHFISNAQSGLLFEQRQQDTLASIWIEGNINMASDEVPADFFLAYYNGRYLDKALKEKTASQLNSVNNIGLLGNASIHLISAPFRFLGISRSRLGLNIGTYGLTEAKITKDLYKIYFNGNAAYENKTATLNPLEFGLIHYSRVGLEYRKLSRRLEFGIGLGMVFGHKVSDISIQNGKLFTAPFGEYLDIDLQLRAEENSISTSNLSKVNGTGIIGSAMLNFSIGPNTKLKISLDQVGKIKWNENTTLSNIDTNYHFQGIELNNLFDSIYLSIKSESQFKEDFIHQTNGFDLSTQLPYQFSIGLTQRLFHDKLNAGVLLHYIHSKVYRPYMMLYGDYRFFSNATFGISVGYGGFGNLNAGVLLKYWLNPKFSVQLNYASLFNEFQKEGELNKMGGFKIIRSF